MAGVDLAAYVPVYGDVVNTNTDGKDCLGLIFKDEGCYILYDGGIGSTRYGYDPLALIAYKPISFVGKSGLQGIDCLDEARDVAEEIFAKFKAPGKQAKYGSMSKPDKACVPFPPLTWAGGKFELKKGHVYAIMLDRWVNEAYSIVLVSSNGKLLRAKDGTLKEWCGVQSFNYHEMVGEVQGLAKLTAYEGQFRKLWPDKKLYKA